MMSSCVERVRGPYRLSVLPLAACASFWRVRDCASTLAKYRSLSTGDSQLCFSSIDAESSGLALRTTPQLGVTILMPALLALDCSTLPSWPLRLNTMFMMTSSRVRDCNP